MRGKLHFDEPLAPFTWFRVGGPAEVLFLPADEDDLAALLAALPTGVPVTALGAASNVIIRDGGVPGVVIRLGRSFANIRVEAPEFVVAGAGALDGAVARFAAKAGLAALEFYAGIPGTVGGALVMNAGCYGGETGEVLFEARGVDRKGVRRTLRADGFGFGYRKGAAPDGMIWTEATFRARADNPGAIMARIGEISARRQTTQPIREKTGGSTFKNPPGHASWRLIEAAGWRGRPLGGAMFSPLHANFMINMGEAKAADLERLGETTRSAVKAQFGFDLEWEIKRIGLP